MNNETQTDKGFSFNWGTGITIAIVLFIATTLSVVAYLVSLDYHVVDKNYYEKAERYQQHIEQAEHARTMEQPVEISLSSDKAVMTIAFPSSVTGDDVDGTVELYRPSDSSLDRSMKLTLGDSRSQQINTRQLTPGKWIVKVQWTANNKHYFTEKDIFL